MSKRRLPELRRPDAPEGMDFVVHPRALAAFDPHVTAAAKEESTISILSQIGESWDGTGVTPNRIAAALRSIGSKPVTVQINSPGGNFFDGLAIYNMLRAHPEAVTVQVLGIAASAASMIAMAGDTIQIAKAGLMMIHNSQWIALGDRHVMIETATAMEVFDELIVGLYVDRTGGDRDEIAGWMDAETFMSGETAVESGFADALLPADKVVKASIDDEPPARRKVAAALSRANMPRSEIRKLMKELSSDTPSAAAEDAMLRAGEAAVDDGTTGLSLALARLKLTRA